MRKFYSLAKSRLIAIAMMLVAIPSALAYQVEIDGIYYNKIDNATVEVTYKESSGNSYSGDIVIPSQITVNGNSYNVTSVSENAFSRCDELTSVVIPNSVTTLGINTMFNSQKLQKVVIGNSIKELPFGMCADCVKLSSVTLGESVTSTGSNAFKGCTSLESIILPQSVTNIEGYSFAQSGLVSIVIPDAVKNIGSAAFFECYSLSTVKMSANVEYIDINAFNGCSKLTALELPNTITTIRLGALNGSGVKSVVIPEKLEYLEDGVIRNCTQLESVTLPKNLSSIYQYNFNDCGNIKTIKCYNPVPPTLANSKFTDSEYFNATVYVPASSVTAYQNADGWKTFWNIKPLEETGIDDTEITNDNLVNVLGHVINVTSPEVVNVYTLNGVNIYHGIGNSAIEVESGIYIVKVGDVVVKVVVR
jgi:hypothetical protein